MSYSCSSLSYRGGTTETWGVHLSALEPPPLFLRYDGNVGWVSSEKPPTEPETLRMSLLVWINWPFVLGSNLALNRNRAFKGTLLEDPRDVHELLGIPSNVMSSGRSLSSMTVGRSDAVSMGARLLLMGVVSVRRVQ